jgi:hypothetical protein
MRLCGGVVDVVRAVSSRLLISLLFQIMYLIICSRTEQSGFSDGRQSPTLRHESLLACFVVSIGFFFIHDVEILDTFQRVFPQRRKLPLATPLLGLELEVPVQAASLRKKNGHVAQLVGQIVAFIFDLLQNRRLRPELFFGGRQSCLQMINQHPLLTVSNSRHV